METITQAEVGAFPISTNVFTVFSNDSVLTPENKLTVLELLHESLDLKTMMNSFASITAKFVRPLNISFQSAHGFFSSKSDTKAYYSKSYNLSLPSTSARIGSITYQSDKPLSVPENKLLTELHNLLVPSLRHALKFSELNSMVLKDHLTNIGNRAYYDESLNRAIEQSSRNQQGLSLMVLDINGFKLINDTYGHLQGDKVLQTFAGLLTKSVRTSDMVFRLGGDEFAVILQPGEQCSVNKVISRLSQEIGANTFLTELQFSTSIGFSHWEMGKSVNELFSQADQKLYQNKALSKANR
ncbi:GGDEF domain-containing protein [Psychromonas aquimarina]|uniref:GGDEF domain-containing protein n=1 Tax=Psychromonas aquimarina TaxID=444919 RepID=UPI0004204257|nr:GGDEF domain-containing protein [Psychromonas aquimarina]